MADKVLFVDDEQAVLDSYRRILFGEFEVDIANGGSDGLSAIKAKGPYSVVISDMRMPVMNGAEFLSQVRDNAPDTVRMLLTGYADLDSAVDAVNRGSIFRFLTKPCEPEVLVNAIKAGLEQYRLISSERELLEKTFMGSIKVLTDVLSAASPEAFGRSVRIAHYVRHMMTRFPLHPAWCFDAAATLSQLGCITLDSELMQQAYAGEHLSSEDQARFDAHPQAAVELLKNIPRLEPVLWLIGQQLKGSIPDLGFEFPSISPTELKLGANMLKLAVAYEQLRVKIPSKSEVLSYLRAKRNEFEPKLIDTLEDLRPVASAKQLRKVPTSKLRAGMILDQQIKNTQGMLLVAKGQELTSALVMRLDNYSKAGTIDKEVMAFVPL